MGGRSLRYDLRFLGFGHGVGEGDGMMVGGGFSLYSFLF